MDNINSNGKDTTLTLIARYKECNAQITKYTKMADKIREDLLSSPAAKDIEATLDKQSKEHFIQVANIVIEHYKKDPYKKDPLYTFHNVIERYKKDPLYTFHDVIEFTPIEICNDNMNSIIVSKKYKSELNPNKIVYINSVITYQSDNDEIRCFYCLLSQKMYAKTYITVASHAEKYNYSSRADDGKFDIEDAAAFVIESIDEIIENNEFDLKEEDDYEYCKSKERKK